MIMALAIAGLLVLGIIGFASETLDRQLGVQKRQSFPQTGFYQPRHFSWNVSESGKVTGISVHQKMW